MNEDIQQLVKSFFGKDSIDDCNLQELQNASREYPYSAPLQLILAEKMRSQHPSLYQKQLQKTSLYFHNILWFDYLVNKEEYIHEDFIISMHPTITAEPENNYDELLLNKENGSKENLLEETIDETKNNAVLLPEHQANAEPVHFQETDINESRDVEGAFVNEDQNVKQEDVPLQDERDAQPELPPLKLQDPVPESENVPLFEPYHTVDYFASQGIKLTLEEKPKDRLGQQLKSFTEWLKTMKRLPQTEINRNIEVGSEQKVQSLAEHSLQEPEVVTEAMAEVWEKQGNLQKAIEMYSKLSLLNPAKSVYFAAKIEQLKKDML